jgi:hypothetical protein
MYVDGDCSGWLANSAVAEVMTSTSTFLGHRGSSLHSQRKTTYRPNPDWPQIELLAPQNLFVVS